MAQSVTYYVLCSLATVVFLVGIAGNVAFWMSGTTEGEGVSLRRKALRVGHRAGAAVIRWQTLRAFGWYALLQGQLWRDGRARWLMSFSLTWGTFELFFIGSIVDLLREYGLTSLSRDESWFATVNEVGGLLVLLGVALALYRRFVQRVPQMRTDWQDALILGWLLVIVVTGYVLEAARILGEGVASPEAAYSFVGFGVSRLGTAGPGWQTAYSPLWWAHWALAISLIAYAPYSKLFHSLAGPLSILARSRGEERLAA